MPKHFWMQKNVPIRFIHGTAAAMAGFYHHRHIHQRHHHQHHRIKYNPLQRHKRHRQHRLIDTITAIERLHDQHHIQHIELEPLAAIVRHQHRVVIYHWNRCQHLSMQLIQQIGKVHRPHRIGQPQVHAVQLVSIPRNHICDSFHF